jgi:hypothetical protein
MKPEDVIADRTHPYTGTRYTQSLRGGREVSIRSRTSVSVQRETDAAIIVPGAKLAATSAAITHYNFMGQSSKAIEPLVEQCIADYDENRWVTETRLGRSGTA